MASEPLKRGWMAKLLSEIRRDQEPVESAYRRGWRDGREAALSAALDVIFSAFEPRPALRQTIEGDMVRAIRALPEPGTEGGE